MAFAAGTVRAVISGSLAGGEVFSMTFAFQGDPAWTQDRLDQLTGVIASNLGTVLGATAVKAKWPTTTVFRKVRTYLTGGAGATVLQSESGDLTIAGTDTGGAPLPNQCALVATLLTGLPGRSKRGRVYVPAPSTGFLNSDGQATDTGVDTLGGAIRDFLDGIAGDSLGAPPVVASATHAAMTPIATVRMDSRFDVQRRRANSQAARHTATGNLS